MKVKMFVHDDYDAVGCVVLAKLVYEEVNVEYHNYHSIELRMKYFIKKKEYEGYDMVIMADISVPEYIARMIQYEFSSRQGFFILLDHHETALWLNKYNWAYVSEYFNLGFNKKAYDDRKECKNMQKTCATSEMYKYLTQIQELSIEKMELLKTEAVMNFVKSVCLYDCWYWVTAENSILKKYLPYEMNTLLYTEGKDWFIENCIEKLLIYKRLFVFSWEEPMLKAEQIKLKSYIKAKNKSMKKIIIEGYTAGVVYAESYVSELGMHLMELNPDIDFVAMIHMPHKISFRTNRTDVDVGKIAEKFGGGGSQQTSACQISNSLTQSFINGLFVHEEDEIT